jgi:hypothetical protein
LIVEERVGGEEGGSFARKEDWIAKFYHVDDRQPIFCRLRAETSYIYEELMRIAAVARDENLVQVGEQWACSPEGNNVFRGGGGFMCFELVTAQRLLRSVRTKGILEWTNPSNSRTDISYRRKCLIRIKKIILKLV